MGVPEYLWAKEKEQSALYSSNDLQERYHFEWQRMDKSDRACSRITCACVLKNRETEGRRRY